MISLAVGHWQLAEYLSCLPITDEHITVLMDDKYGMQRNVCSDLQQHLGASPAHYIVQEQT